jgi:hypothetical protein
VKKHAEYQYIEMHMNAKMDCEVIWHSSNNDAIKTQKDFVYVDLERHLAESIANFSLNITWGSFVFIVM